MSHLFQVEIRQFFEDRFDSPPPKIPSLGIHLFTSCVVLLGTFFRYIVQRLNCPIPYAVFVMSVGMIWGIGVWHDQDVAKFSVLALICSHDVFLVYLPVIIFRIAFCIDVHALMKSLPQVVIISIPVFVLSACWTGLLMRLVIDPDWTLGAAVFFGVITSATYPAEVVRLLKEIGLHTKYTRILLEGEAIIGAGSVLVLTSILEGHIYGYVVQWYQFVMVMLRLITFGPILGYFTGLLGCALMRWMPNDITCLLMLTISVPCIARYVAYKFLSTAGVYCLIIPGIMMGIERTALPPEIDKILVDFWEWAGHLFDTLLYIIAGVRITTIVIVELTISDYVFILITYLIAMVGRFLSFLVFLPILSKVGYGMTIKNMLICVWGGLRSPVLLALMLMCLEGFAEKQKYKSYGLIVCSHVAGVYFLSLLINGSLTPLLLKVMGLMQVSMARQANMINCFKHVFERRERTTAILKMDRFLSDANWTVVAIGTNLKHPYKTPDELDEADDYFIGYRFTYCSDCRKEVLSKPTPQELKGMIKEARLRVLKAKKVCYSRQYEQGMISKEAIRILNQTIDIAMDTEEALPDLSALYKRFRNEGCFARFVRNRLKDLIEKSVDMPRPPRTCCRRLCYYLVTNPFFEVFIDIVIILNVVPIVVEMLLYKDLKNENRDDHMLFAMINLTFILIYQLEFVVKILGYSRTSLGDGFRAYFRSWWNVMDFIILLLCWADMAVDFAEISIESFSRTKSGHWISLFEAMRFFRFIRLFRLLRLWIYCYPLVIKGFDKRIDNDMAFTYEMGKGYVNGEEEVMQMLPYMIDHDEIKEDMKKRMEKDRLEITKLLGLTQKDRPWIAITVKTRQAIRTVLNSMKDTVQDLKVSGWVDEGEHAMLMESLSERFKYVSKIKYVEPSPPAVIFKEVSWMAGEKRIVDYLYENVVTRSYEPGVEICSEGQPADGIFIVVTGLLLLSYEPQKTFLLQLVDFGLLPIVDYMPPSKFYDPLLDYVVSGNSFGELGTLTGRVYSCTITADTHSQVYFLSKDVIKEALSLSPDPVAGLQCRMWRSISIRIALPILMNVPAYQSTHLDMIKYALERAFVPNLSFFKIFVINEMIEDIVLIEGLALDFNTRDAYVAPTYIPRTIKKLILPNSSLVHLPIEFETKFLIIPTKDADEYDIMLKEEDTAELVPMSSSKCLHHLIQKRKQRRSTRLSIDSGRRSSAASDKYSTVALQARNSRT